MGKTKDDIWSKFGQSYKHGDAKLSYYKCSACDEPMIAAASRMHVHWAKCKNHPCAIGQLYVGFQ
jgi:ssDNA-binding Zn-finger/Zn-ribbon topoisomerase 1